MKINMGGQFTEVPDDVDMLFVDLNDEGLTLCIDLRYLDVETGAEWRAMPEPFVAVTLTDDGWASDAINLIDIPKFVIDRPADDPDAGNRKWVPRP